MRHPLLPIKTILTLVAFFALAPLSLLQSTSCSLVAGVFGEADRDSSGSDGSDPSRPAGRPDPAERPDGWASVTGAPAHPGGSGAAESEIFTVTNRAEFLAAVRLGGSSASDLPKIIYVDGMIDLCSDAAGSHLEPEHFIALAGYGAQYADWAAWREAYAASCAPGVASTLGTVQSKLAKAQKAVVIADIGSNTSILGIGAGSGFRNGTLSLSGKTNVVIRNLAVLDSYDYFPKWDEGENLINSEYDTVSISNGSTRVWIDHCALGDGGRPDSGLPRVTIGGEEKKWVAHDGLLDVTKGSDLVTISWNLIGNHDKTMLVGSSDSNGGTGTANDTGKLRVTLHHNWFNGAAQRLPRVRFGRVHVYANLYENVGSYAIGVGDHARVWSESNTFASVSSWFAAMDDGANEGYVWDVGSVNVNQAELDSPSLVGWNPAEEYTYAAGTAADEAIATRAGAGPGKF